MKTRRDFIKAGRVLGATTILSGNKVFSRKWFAWPNTLFGELMLYVQDKKPYLLKTDISCYL
jgi:meiotically up-regulated gene 157 (Mug157) protein